ncbi:MAG: lipid-binding SYLF domain-containing protein [Candidatus Nitrohelix vancouverensis]|uniref:Lipid-binding SYLF domain-containing protein n=1 Tax=Candidatus Nitrohelix vancouverensis TaxID=2705534 RepID=A0A7T0C1M4_9BACT|nr:MAG: lipid-binding SYLF domain-containing protein [Candidatus Nitrohelix vancouverensis]
MNRIIQTVFICLLTLLPFSTAHALDDQQELLRNAVQAVEDIIHSEDEHVPTELLSKAKAIIIFPKMLKGGFIFAARYGQGVISTRSKTTGLWGPPAFVYTAGASYGFQVGAEAIDLLLLVMSESGVQGLLKNQFTLGADVGVSAGPVGRHAEASTDILLQGEIYSYSRSMGAFAGVSVKGTVITSNEGSNEKFYGEPLSAKDILYLGKVESTPETAKRFMQRLNKLLPIKKREADSN